MKHPVRIDENTINACERILRFRDKHNFDKNTCESHWQNHRLASVSNHPPRLFLMNERNWSVKLSQNDASSTTARWSAAATTTTSTTATASAAAAAAKRSVTTAARKNVHVPCCFTGEHGFLGRCWNPENERNGHAESWTRACEIGEPWRRISYADVSRFSWKTVAIGNEGTSACIVTRSNLWWFARATATIGSQSRRIENWFHSATVA